MLSKLKHFLIISAFCLTASAFAENFECYNNECYNNECYNNECCTTNCSYNNSFTYVKLGAGLQKRVGPAIGIGRRFGIDDAAVDLSINWIGSEHSGYLSCPKVMYIRYLNPQCPNSFYYGAGLSLGSSGAKKVKFAGLQGELTLGYEMYRDSKFRTFVSLDVSQGIIAFKSKDNKFAPAAALTFGVGF